ncbi:MAG: TrkA C-terminal domain-containing protein [Myxococcota bacterium]
MIICTVYFIVLVGTVAYQLTGLDWDTAQFQALSAFTMAGFTTRASERVVNDPSRRKITMALIASGYAATASVIATLVSSISTNSAQETAINLIMLASVTMVTVYSIRRMGTHPRLADSIRRYLARRMTHETVPHEDLMYYRRGYALTRVEVPPRSRVVGLRLRDTDLKRRRLQVLAIEREGEMFPVPEADHRIHARDHLVIYGEIKALQDAFAASFEDEEPAAVQGVSSNAEPAPVSR